MQTVEPGRQLHNGYIVVVTSEDGDVGVVLAVAPYMSIFTSQYATWKYNVRDGETYLGHYHATWQAAITDYNERKGELS